MSLVKRRSGKDDELITANINFPDEWRVLSVDTKTWGENWNEDVENTEEAVIHSMIAYLFAQGYIVPDVETDEDESAGDEEVDVELCGRCGIAKLEELCRNPEGCDRHICEATENNHWCCSCVMNEALSDS